LEREGPAKAILIAMEAQKQGLEETEKVIVKSLQMPLEKRIISDPMGVMGLAYSPDGKAIVSMDSYSLRFWSPDDGNEIDTYPLKASAIPAVFGRIEWSPAGEWISIGSQEQDKTLLLAPCSHPKLKVLFTSCAGEDKDRQRILGDPDHRAGLAKFSNDGRWMVISAFGTPLTRWDLANGDGATAKTTSLNVAPGDPDAFAISPDMKTVAAGLQNGEIRLIDPDSGGLQATLLPPPEEQKDPDHRTVIALLFNPSDPNMLVASESGGGIFVWDVKTKTCKKLPGAQGRAWSIAFSRDGQFVTAGNNSGVIRTWETEDLANEPSQLNGHTGAVLWIDYNPDGTSLASASNKDKTIRLWNLRSPLDPEVNEVTPPEIQSIGAQSSEAPPDWSKRISLPKDFGRVAAYVESDTGRLVVASKEGRLALYNLKDGWREPVAEWRSPADVAILKLEHNPDRMVTVSSSGLQASWPFFRDVKALISFAADQLPFFGKGRLTLSAEDLCKIAPPDSPCKAEPAQVQ